MIYICSQRGMVRVNMQFYARQSADWTVHIFPATRLGAIF